MIKYELFLKKDVVGIWYLWAKPPDNSPRPIFKYRKYAKARIALKNVGHDNYNHGLMKDWYHNHPCDWDYPEDRYL